MYYRAVSQFSVRSIFPSNTIALLLCVFVFHSVNHNFPLTRSNVNFAYFTHFLILLQPKVSFPSIPLTSLCISYIHIPNCCLAKVWHNVHKDKISEMKGTGRLNEILWPVCSLCGTSPWLRVAWFNHWNIIPGLIPLLFRMLYYYRWLYSSFAFQ